jgi:AbrB family looped-hinge helix DNA binding protein
MAIVTVKNKYQVVIPRNVRDQIGIAVGDLLDAKVERGKITLTPKPLIGRGIAEGLEDIRKGRVYGPYRSASDAMQAFHARTAKLAKQPKRSAS